MTAGFIAHVGDSRIYLLRQAQVIQLTEDHSLINELIRRGKVTKDGLANSPYSAYKNAVTRAVGVYETVQVDTIDFDILPGDQFLLCSDGLHSYLDDDKIKELLRQRGHHRRSPSASSIWPTKPAATTTSPPSRCGSQPAGADSHATTTAPRSCTRKIDVLKQMPLFRHLTYKEIMRVLNVTEVADYAPGDRRDDARTSRRGAVHPAQAAR